MNLYKNLVFIGILFRLCSDQQESVCYFVQMLMHNQLRRKHSYRNIGNKVRVVHQDLMGNPSQCSQIEPKMEEGQALLNCQATYLGGGWYSASICDQPRLPVRSNHSQEECSFSHYHCSCDGHPNHLSSFSFPKSVT